jgi:hypothetical protein
LAEQDVKFILQREDRHEAKLELRKGARAAVSASSCSSSIEGKKIELHAAAEENETIKADTAADEEGHRRLECDSG